MDKSSSLCGTMWNGSFGRFPWITSNAASGDSADRYLPLKERAGENWDFSVEIVPRAEESYHAMREFGSE